MLFVNMHAHARTRTHAHTHTHTHTHSLTIIPSSPQLIQCGWHSPPSSSETASDGEQVL